jgi:hypothetical protein
MGKTRTKTPTSSVTLDAGALIALDRGNRRMIALVQQAVRSQATFHVPAGVVGQVWRDASRQVNVARFLRSPDVQIHALDGAVARACGELCRAAGTSDVIDASVVITARQHRDVVITSDPEDLLRLDPALLIERI